MPHLPQPLTTSLNSLTGPVVPPARHRVPAKIERAVRKAVALEHGRGLVAAARIRAVDYASTEALHATAGLAELEALYLSRSPLGEGRYRAIADTAAITMAAIVAETGRA